MSKIRNWYRDPRLTEEIEHERFAHRPMRPGYSGVMKHKSIGQVEFKLDRFSGDYVSTHKFNGEELHKYDPSKYIFAGLKNEAYQNAREKKVKRKMLFLKEKMLGRKPIVQTYAVWTDYQRCHFNNSILQVESSFKDQNKDYMGFLQPKQEGADSQPDEDTEEATKSKETTP